MTSACFINGVFVNTLSRLTIIARLDFLSKKLALMIPKKSEPILNLMSYCNHQIPNEFLILPNNFCNRSYINKAFKYVCCAKDL